MLCKYSTLSRSSYKYNVVFQITTENGNFNNYRYDRANRLTQATPPALQQKGLPVESYAYDKVGNRIGSAHQPGEWQYGPDNQLLKMGLNHQHTTFDYSPNGNVIKETQLAQVKKYTYDATDRLTQVTNNNTEIATYQYDPLGRRISKTVNDETFWYLYVDEGLLAELDEQGNMTVAYGWLPDNDWGTAPLWQANVGNNQTLQEARYHYLHTDHLGTPLIATDEQGNVSWKGISDAFGKMLLDDANQITINLRFPGQYYDAETDSHYNYFRDYNPAIGRYQQRDPIGLMGGMNPYGYANGNPMLYIDSEGLLAPAIGWGVIRQGVVRGRGFGALRPLSSFQLLLRPTIHNLTMAGSRAYGASMGAAAAQALQDAQNAADDAKNDDQDNADDQDADNQNAEEQCDETAKKPEHKKPKPKVSGKDGAKDVPSWAKGEKPYVGESGNDFADRVLTGKYGKGNYRKGPDSEYNKIRKWGDRAFENPKPKK